MKKPFLCTIGIHDWLRPFVNTKVVRPKRGPFDNRTDEGRTESTLIKTCAQCGKKKEHIDTDYGYY